MSVCKWVNVGERKRAHVCVSVKEREREFDFDRRKRNFVFHNFFSEMNRSTVNRSALLVPPKKQDNWSSIKTEGKEKGLFLSLSLPLSLSFSP